MQSSIRQTDAAVGLEFAVTTLRDEAGRSLKELSDERRTWYSEPLYAANNARVVLCAATHGVPPAA